MHIFSKKGSADDAAGFVAPSPKRDNRIRSTTSMKSLRRDNEDAQPELATGSDGAVPDPPVSQTQPGSHEVEDPQSILRSNDYATNGGLVASKLTNADNNSENNNNNNNNDMNEMASAPNRHREGSTSTDPMSDSAYASATGSPRNNPKSLRDSAEMQPIPVVWTEGTEPPPDDIDEDGQLQVQARPRSKGAFNATDPKRSQSMRSFRSGSMLRDRDGQDSVRTTPSGRRTPRRRLSLTGGGFASGAGTVGPASKPQDEETQLFRSRSVSAEASLTKKQKLKIGKAESECTFSFFSSF